MADIVSNWSDKNISASIYGQEREPGKEASRIASDCTSVTRPSALIKTEYLSTHIV